MGNAACQLLQLYSSQIKKKHNYAPNDREETDCNNVIKHMFQYPEYGNYNSLIGFS